MSGVFDNNISQLFDGDGEQEMRDDLEILEEYLAGVLLSPLPSETGDEVGLGWQVPYSEIELPGEESLAIEVTEETAAASFTTSTMAEIYVSQGFVQRAIDIYEEMLSESPLSEGITNRISELREMLVAEEVTEQPTETITAIPVESEISVVEFTGNSESAVKLDAWAENIAEAVPPPVAAKGEHSVVATLENWLENISSRRQ